MRKQIFTIASLLVLASLVLTACGPQATPQTVEVTKIVAGTPVVQQVVVTATPPPAAAAKQFTSKDPTTWVTAEFGSPETLDSASDYETSGLEITQNTHDYLFFYKREVSSEVVPMLATEVPTKQNGGISADGMTYTFKIRPGVKFHNGDPMTAHDVAFTLQRFILQGNNGSTPAWIITQPVLGADISSISQLVDPKALDNGLDSDAAGIAKSDPAKLKAACQAVTNAITADDNAMTVTMKLKQPWPALVISLAGFGAVEDQKWIGANGGWDGSCDTWQNFYFSNYDDINKLGVGTKENGTGPFILENNNPGQEIDLKANPDYWVKEPLWDGGPTGAPKLQRVVLKNVADFATRLASFQAGDLDSIQTAGGNHAQWSQLDPLSGQTCDNKTGKCQATGTPDQPGLALTNIYLASYTQAFFTFDINTTGGNPYIGSGKLDGNGIPPDFFNDVNIRKAFTECFDFDSYIQDVFQGDATQVNNLMLPGESGYDANATKYKYDPKQCAADFKASTLKSPDGKGVWDVGFRFTMGYNLGNTNRQTIAQIFQADMASINPKFVISVEAPPWPAFLADSRNHKVPLFVVGWQEDYPDTADWVGPFAATGGTYVFYANIPKAITSQFDPLIQSAATETDAAKREATYKQLNQLYYAQYPGIPMALALDHHYFQQWDQGVYTNPLYGWLYYYPLSKK
jgi:peptide/nickel transport system substrate-binding protein